MKTQKKLAEIQSQLDMLFEENRMKTFKKWVFGDDKNCSAAKLAEAGFYYVGSKLEPDAVQCFLCDKQLDGWEENDDPWSEHLGHSKGCTFAQLRMTENELTLNQMHKIKEELVMRQAKKIFDEQIKVYSESLQDIKKLLNV